MSYAFTLRHLANEALPFMQDVHAAQLQEIEKKEKNAARYQRGIDNAKTPTDRTTFTALLEYEKEEIEAAEKELRRIDHICTALERLNWRIEDGEIENAILISADEMSNKKK